MAVITKKVHSISLWSKIKKLLTFKKICFIIACLWTIGLFIFVLHAGTWITILISSLSHDEQQQHNTGELVENQAAITTASEKDQPQLQLTPERIKPSKPLCNECLEIIKQAQQIDIRYVDVHTNHEMEHPHMGATDPSGILGQYVHDETNLRYQPPEFIYPNLIIGCKNRDTNYEMLQEKIKVEYSYDHVHNMNPNYDSSSYPKLFCIIYTTENSHHKISAIRETWGPKCDGFLVASNLTDPSIDAVNIVHEGEEAYNNIYQKVRSIWSYVYDNYYNKYDWFHIGGDDLFLIVENLRLYIESEEIVTASNGGIYLPSKEHPPIVQTPLFLGRRFAYMGDMDNIFNSGGSGYTINKASLKTLVVLGFQQYFPHAHTFSEDTMVARILKKYGVLPYETKDEYGAERYMPFNPGHHLTYRLPKNIKNIKDSNDWYYKYSINIKEGLDHCSTNSIAFHYIKDDVMRRFYALLYNLCPADTLE